MEKDEQILKEEVNDDTHYVESLELHGVIEYFIKAERKDAQFYFRGENREFNLRTPSLYLEESLAVNGSDYYYRRLTSELGRDDYQNNASLARLLSELQHYGAKTRMLDITTSPLIALYFAVEKNIEEDDNHDGYVYIFKSDMKEEKFDTGRTIAIKSALNFVQQEVINDFLSACEQLEEYISDKDEMTLEEFQQYVSREKIIVVNKLIEDIKHFMIVLNQKAKVREKLIYPFKIYKDITSAHVVIPAKTTDRIRQQQGAFIYPKFMNTSKKSHEEIKREIHNSIMEFKGEMICKKKNSETKVIKLLHVPAKTKKKIRRQLALLGVTAGSIYPDIQNQSRALLEQLNKK